MHSSNIPREDAENHTGRASLSLSSCLSLLYCTVEGSPFSVVNLCSFRLSSSAPFCLLDQLISLKLCQ
jgi:hypothetical protein